jgi:hypothetical protein
MPEKHAVAVFPVADETFYRQGRKPMIGSWNMTQGHGPAHLHINQNAASTVPGPNPNRRRFVELAVASAFGASLVGLSAGPAGASGSLNAKRQSTECAGRGTGGFGESIEYKDLAGVHQRWA